MTLTPGQPHWSYLGEHKQTPITTTTRHAHNRNSPLFSNPKKKKRNTDESSRALSFCNGQTPLFQNGALQVNSVLWSLCCLAVTVLVLPGMMNDGLTTWADRSLKTDEETSVVASHSVEVL